MYEVAGMRLQEAYSKIIKLMLIRAPDRVVEVVGVADDSKGFVGVIRFEDYCFAC